MLGICILFHLSQKLSEILSLGAQILIFWANLVVPTALPILLCDNSTKAQARSSHDSSVSTFPWQTHPIANIPRAQEMLWYPALSAFEMASLMLRVKMCCVSRQCHRRFNSSVGVLCCCCAIKAQILVGSFPFHA